MKRLAFISLLSLMATVATAADVVPYTSLQNLTVRWTRTYSATDTAVGAKYLDTLYSPWVIVPAAKTFPFTAYIDGKHSYNFGAIDTLMVNDSMFVRVQTTNIDPTYLPTAKTDATMMTTTTLGTILLGSADFDTVVSYVPTIARDTTMITARYMRAMFIIVDSTEVTAPGHLGQTVGRQLTLYVNAKP